MAESFDPYRSWLGIRDPRRPPTFYRLLGLELFEDDPEVISNAADRQMAHVRTFQAGKHSSLSQQLLNELATARLHLLDKQRKVAYDATLQAEQAAAAPAVPAPPPVAQPARQLPPPLAQPASAVTDEESLSSGASGIGRLPPSAGRSGIGRKPAPAAPRSGVQIREVGPQAKPGSAVMVAQPVQFRPQESPARASGGNGLVLAVGIGGAVVGLGCLAFVGLFLAGFFRSAEPVVVAQNAPTVEATVTPTVVDEPTMQATVEPTAAPADTSSDPEPTAERVDPELIREPTLRKFPRQRDAVRAIAWSPSGKTALSAGADGAIHVWRTSNGDELPQLPGNNGPVNALAVAPNGTDAISGGKDGRLRLWSLESSEIVATLPGHTSPILAVALASGTAGTDAQFAFSGDQTGNVRLWDLKEQIEVDAFQAHNGPVTCVVLSSDAKVAVTGCEDGTVKVWDVEQKLEDARLPGDGKPVRGLAMSPDGRYVVVVGDQPLALVWDLQKPQAPVMRLAHQEALHAVTFAPSGKALLTAGDRGFVTLWDLTLGQRLKQWKFGNAPQNCVAMSLDATQVLAGGNDGNLRLWRTPESLIEQLKPVETSLGPMVTEIADGLVREWASHNGPVRAIDITTDSARVATGGRDGVIRLWSPKLDLRLVEWSAHLGGVRTLKFSPDGKQLLSAGQDGKLKLWDGVTGKELQSFASSAGAMEQVAWLPAGNLLCVTADRAVQVIALAGGTAAQTTTGAGYYDQWLVDAAGNSALSTGYDHWVRRWSLPEASGGQKLFRLGEFAVSSALASAGKVLVTGDWFGQVHAWHADNGTELRRISKHTGPVWAVAVSADGQQALSGGHDRILSVWDLKSGREVQTWEGHAAPISALCLSADSKWAVSGDRSGGLKLWRVPAYTPLAEDETTKPTVTQRVVTPDPANQSDCLSKLKQQFKLEFARRVFNEKLEFAKRLVLDGMTEADPGMRFVMLREGRDQFVLIGELPSALRAIDALDEFYVIDRTEMQVEVFTDGISKLNTPAQAQAALDRLLALIDEQLAADRYEVAFRLAKVAESLGKKSGSASYVTLIQGLVKQGRIWQREFDKLKKARETLVENPSDPTANEALGRFYTLVKDDWTTGLPMLALGNDTTLRDLAHRELEWPNLPGLQLELARAWQAQTEPLKGEERVPGLSRAFFWIQQALPNLDMEQANTATSDLRRLQEALAPFVAVYSSQVAEAGFRGLNLGKGSLPPYTARDKIRPFVVGGVPSPHGIGARLDTEGQYSVTYSLFGRYQTFIALVGLNDTHTGTAQMGFRVIADGNTIWDSRAFERPGDTQPVRLDIAGVKTLTLVTLGGTGEPGAHGVWIEPQFWRLRFQAEADNQPPTDPGRRMRLRRRIVDAARAAQPN